jgi:hypothetical protein
MTLDCVRFVPSVDEHFVSIELSDASGRDIRATVVQKSRPPVRVHICRQTNYWVPITPGIPVKVFVFGTHSTAGPIDGCDTGEATFGTVIATFTERAPSSAPAPSKGTTSTSIAGGWEGSPPVVPTSLEEDANHTYHATFMGHAIFDGDLVGVTIFSGEATVDPNTGDWEGTATTEFHGAWLGDGSQGTLKWHEYLSGNFITGAFQGYFDIDSGSGDPSFQCSSGHFTWDGYTILPASYGGYSGTWIHGCKTEGAI